MKYFFEVQHTPGTKVLTLFPALLYEPGDTLNPARAGVVIGLIWIGFAFGIEW